VVATLVGCFLALLGVRADVGGSFFVRLAYLIGVAWVATLMGVALTRGVGRLALVGDDARRQSVVAATVMTPAMGLLVWGADRLFARPPPPVGRLGGYIYVSLIFSVFINLMVYALRRRRSEAAAPVAPPKFLERLPYKLRGAELWAVEAEDHYLRLHTSRGQDLILMRLADAVAELEGLEGAQTHRSWWVARGAITGVRRGDGRATLTLQDGSDVPVSRTYAAMLRQRGWI